MGGASQRCCDGRKMVRWPYRCRDIPLLLYGNIPLGSERPRLGLLTDIAVMGIADEVGPHVGGTAARMERTSISRHSWPRGAGRRWRTRSSTDALRTPSSYPTRWLPIRVTGHRRGGWPPAADHCVTGTAATYALDRHRSGNESQIFHSRVPITRKPGTGDRLARASNPDLDARHETPTLVIST